MRLATGPSHPVLSRPNPRRALELLLLSAQVRSVEIEMQAQVEDLQKAVKENKQKGKHWEEKLVYLRERVAQAQAEALANRPAAKEGEGDDAEGESVHGALVDLTEEELDALDTHELQADVAQLEEAFQGMNGNVSVIAEYHARSSEWRMRLGEFDGVTEARDVQRRRYEQLRKQRLDEFMVGFRTIGMKLKEMYQVRE